MKKMAEENNYNYPQNSFLTSLKSIGSLILSLVLFLGGIWLLSLRLPGWSFFLGLPAIQIGLIFMIFTFDGFARHKVGPDSLQIITCSICGKPTVAPRGQKRDICPECQERITS